MSVFWVVVESAEIKTHSKMEVAKIKTDGEVEIVICANQGKK